MDKIKSGLKEFLPYIIVIVVVLIIKTYFFSTVIVSGDSMKNTLLNNDFMILDKISYRTKDIERFDIVVIQGNNTKLIKRIIGLPGEEIEYIDNQLYVNGKKIEDNYGKGTTYNFSLKDLGISKVPDNQYFVLGDNREESLDSRLLGFIDREDILGHATFILFPFSRLGTVE
ncbi:MAG: signal peptidase I [Firmicutes bacterium]|nr:signal peptidase I [Bacillota bacterium]